MDLSQGSRFVFHQLSSGSFRHAKTFWADSFYPDLFKLNEELEDFHRLAGFTPEILADPKTSAVIIYDVILNMALETMRGDKRHGSCGMGINEADLRTKAGFGYFLEDVKTDTEEQIIGKLLFLRDTYYPRRFRDLGIDGLRDLPMEYRELFELDSVAENVAKVWISNREFVKVQTFAQMANRTDALVFETGQGLLLDGACVKYMPHVTASRTGLANPIRILEQNGLQPTEVVYVTRTYVTRHGAGPLFHETKKEDLGDLWEDITNQPNPWQGAIRYAYHETLDGMLEPIAEDLKQMPERMRAQCRVALFVTHLNETHGNMKCVDKDVCADRLLTYDGVKTYIDKLYLSDAPVCPKSGVRSVTS